MANDKMIIPQLNYFFQMLKRQGNCYDVYTQGKLYKEFPQCVKEATVSEALISCNKMGMTHEYETLICLFTVCLPTQAPVLQSMSVGQRAIFRS